MGCDSCKSMDKLDKLLSFLGISLCYKCKGKGRVELVTCSCCQSEITTCPECEGHEFIVEEDSILKSLLDLDDEADSGGIGLCD